MKFKFHSKESRLFDIMQLPRLLFTSLDVTDESKEDFQATTLLKQIKDDRYKENIKNAQKSLAPHQDTIRKFYADEFMSAYDLFLLLVYTYPILGHDTINGYFNSILNDSENTIKRNLITSMLAVEQTFEDIDKAKLTNDAEHLMGHKEELMGVIKDVPTDDLYKWQLLMLLETPKNHIETFKTLLNDIKPIYDTLFKPEEQHALDLASSFEQPNTSPQDFFEQMTNQLVSANVLPDDYIPLLISVVFPYSFMQKEDWHLKRTLIWGLKMDQGFKLIAKQKDNQAQERIQVFKLLGDKTRYEVLKLIARGTTSTKAIAETLNVSSATISYHINAFFTNNIIRFAKTKKAKYEVNTERLDALWDTFKDDVT